jgi:Pvc16 N-terminal domain
MLHDIDRTIEELLKRQLPANLVSSTTSDGAAQLNISFDTPDTEFARHVPRPAIGLFLYDVRENLGLRNSERLVEQRASNSASRKLAPLRIDCSYLVTAWAGGETPDLRTEHLLLGEVMKVLARYTEIPQNLLQGSLINQEFPMKALTLRPTLLNSIGEFWQAIGGKPKAAFNYTITASLAVDETFLTIPLVIDKQISIGIK